MDEQQTGEEQGRNAATVGPQNGGEPRTMEETLSDVRKAMEAGECRKFGPIEAYVVNYNAPQDFPRKFFYNGCTRDMGNGRSCAMPVEGQHPCQHNSLTAGTWRPMYRFEIVLFNGSRGSDCPAGNPPLRATIFDSASSLLGIPCADFCRKPELEQCEFVHGVTCCLHYVEVFLRTLKKAKAIVEAIKILPKVTPGSPEVEASD